VAAIYGDVADIAEMPGGRLTESVWNTTSSLEHQPYSYSKTLAEREAWRIADAQERWRLVVVNPALVVGPALGRQPTSDSFAIVKQLGDGTMRMGGPRAGLGVVDVRDVAQAHLAAAFLPDASGRNIVCGHETTILELGQTLRPRFGDRLPLPNRAIPKWLLWLVAPAAGQTRRFVARNVGYPWRADTSKSRRELGMTYRPMKETIEEMVQQMLDAGAFAKR
jgi:dihydroflavonol-4-reductase